MGAAELRQSFVLGETSMNSSSVSPAERCLVNICELTPAGTAGLARLGRMFVLILRCRVMVGPGVGAGIS